MLPRRLWLLASLGAALIIWLLVGIFDGGDDRPEYETHAVERGPIVATVTATGTLNPLQAVDVGTYVSGPILAIDADFNTRVTAGQRIAKIDPRTFEGKVAHARAALATARAHVDRARADLKLKHLQRQRQEELARRSVAAESELDVARSNAEQAEAELSLATAQVEQAQATLDEAEVNLGYTNIVSPIDGMVVSRNVSVGQTVAASFQTPVLFRIAGDLSRMQVNAFVSEADIGRVHEGQNAYFTVDAYPGRNFPAVVKQVRNAPQALENVVTYDVVLEVDNKESLLKPGLTAGVSIVTAEAADVLKVPIAALRFRPPKQSGAAEPSGTAQAKPIQSGTDAAASGTVYRLERGEPVEIRVQTGLSDDSMIAVESDDLAPGELVITRRGTGEAKREFSLFGGMRGGRR